MVQFLFLFEVGSKNSFNFVARHNYMSCFWKLTACKQGGLHSAAGHGKKNIFTLYFFHKINLI